MGIAPDIDLDPFDEAFLADPWPHHATMREAGAVVRLSRYGIWAMARHEPVQAALKDWETYCSGAGVGLSDFSREPPWRPPSVILEADPPLHSRTRGALARILSRPALARLREGFEARAAALVGSLAARREFDAVADLAEAFPLSVFPDAVGLCPDGRENLLPYGDLVFNGFGPDNRLRRESMARAGASRDWIMAQCRREALAPAGLGAQLYAAADAGEITAEEAGLLVRSLLSAGLDTTVHALGHAFHCFADWPQEYAALRAEPSRIGGVLDEVVRYTSPVQTFFRTTTREVDVEGTTIPGGSKVLLFLAAANRDPRRWEEPDRFDVRRKAIGHVGFGAGIHMCVGQMLAKLEAEVLLAEVVRRFASIERAGEPRFRLNNTLRGLASLPVRVRLA
jgi:cytochrome P450